MSLVMAPLIVDKHPLPQNQQGCPQLLSSLSETPGLSFVHLGGLGNRGWCGVLRIARRQAPLGRKGLGELVEALPSEV